MRNLLRSRLDEALGFLCRLVLGVFFREVRVEGAERIPRGVPLVPIANHVNNLVDPMLVLAFLGLRPRFLAKHTLWGHPVVAPLLILAGALPVYRRQDAVGARAAGNLATFGRCSETLAVGATIALFPEGKSHNHPTTLPLKTGAARIALGAENAYGPLGLRILPVGLVYDAKGTFLSRVRVVVGEPIDPWNQVALYREDPHRAVRDLTRRMATALAGVVTTPLGGPRREVRKAIPTAAWPLTALGVVLNWLPYKIPGWISQRFTSTLDEPATYKVLAAAFAFPLCWAAESAGTTLAWGLSWGLAVAVAAPACGRVALAWMRQRSASAPTRVRCGS